VVLSLHLQEDRLQESHLANEHARTCSGTGRKEREKGEIRHRCHQQGYPFHLMAILQKTENMLLLLYVTNVGVLICVFPATQRGENLKLLVNPMLVVLSRLSCLLEDPPESCMFHMTDTLKET
jgi:hypothetical protein